RDVRGGPRGRPRPHCAAGHLGDRCEDRPGIWRRDPQGREDAVHVKGNPARGPPSIAACRGRNAAGTSDGTPGMIFNRPTKYICPYVYVGLSDMSLSDGLAMPSAFDLIGHNPALQEHWLRRFIAFVIDAVIVAVVGLFVAIPLSFPFLGWAWWFSGIFWGGMWFIYSVLLETLFGGTVGKKIVALRVVAIDRNLDVVHTVVRNLPKIFPLIVLVD